MQERRADHAHAHLSQLLSETGRHQPRFVGQFASVDFFVDLDKRLDVAGDRGAMRSNQRDAVAACGLLDGGTREFSERRRVLDDARLNR